MAEDRRLYQKDPQTKRYNVVNLPSSGAFGKYKSLDKAYDSRVFLCPCEAGIGCSTISHNDYASVCDIIVEPCDAPEFICLDSSGSEVVHGAYKLAGCDPDGYALYFQFTGSKEHFIYHGVETIDSELCTGWFIRSEDTIFYFASSNYPIPLGGLVDEVIFSPVEGIEPPPVLVECSEPTTTTTSTTTTPELTTTTTTLEPTTTTTTPP